MKKLAIAMMMGIAAMSASAQVNYKIGRASCRERVYVLV